MNVRTPSSRPILATGLDTLEDVALMHCHVPLRDRSSQGALGRIRALVDARQGNERAVPRRAQ
jgi:hypothetical protein